MVVWAVIGSTTSVNRSVQIWVTSNLWWDSKGGGWKEGGDTAVSATTREGNRRAYWKRWGDEGKWGGKRWDWREVGVKCVLPCGVVDFIMAWAEELRRELAAGRC